MGMTKRNAGGSKGIYLEFNAKDGCLTRGYGETAEEIRAVDGRLVDVFVMKPRPDASAKAPEKLVAVLRDDEAGETYNVLIPLASKETNTIGFSSMKAAAVVAGAAFHTFSTGQNVQFRAGLSDADAAGKRNGWFVADAPGEDGKYSVRLPKVWGFDEQGAPNFGVPSANDPAVLVSPPDFVVALNGKNFIQTDKVMGLVNTVVDAYKSIKAAAQETSGAEGAGGEGGEESAPRPRQ